MACQQTMISIKEIFNDYDEIHAFILGFADAFLWFDKATYDISLQKIIIKEAWYYRAGMVGGGMWFVLFPLSLGCLVKVIIF